MVRYENGFLYDYLNGTVLSPSGVINSKISFVDFNCLSVKSAKLLADEITRIFPGPEWKVVLQPAFYPPDSAQIDFVFMRDGEEVARRNSAEYGKIYHGAAAGDGFEKVRRQAKTDLLLF